MSHLRGIPTLLRERFGVPVVFYDGDVPMSLPEFGGHRHRLQLLLRRRPVRVRPRRLELGGRAGPAPRARRPPGRGGLLGGRSGALPAAPGREGDRRLLLRLRRQVPSGVDGGDDRRAEPRVSDVDFALGGRDFRGDTGRARLAGDVPFNVFSRAISAARINLNVTRRAHATVYASSTSPAVRAGDVRRDDRLQPARGDRALVRAGPRAGRRRRTRTRRPTPTRSCSTTRARRRRWGARPRARARRAHVPPPRAAAARPARARRPGGGRVAEVATEARPAGARADCASGGSRSSPRYNEEESVSARDRGDPRVRPRLRDRRRRRRLRRPDTAAAARARGARRAAPVQPRDRRRRADRLPLRASRTASSSPSASTATASTIRRSSARCSGRCSPTRRTSSSGRASPAARRATGRRATRRIGITILARTLSVIVAPTRHRPDVGLPGAEPHGDRALRRRLPARLPRGRGGADGAQAPSCAWSRCRCRCASASAGRSSIGALASVYYMVKVMLALFVGLFRTQRDAPGGGRE